MCVCDLQNVICCESYSVKQYCWVVVPDDSEGHVAFVLKGVTDYLAKWRHYSTLKHQEPLTQQRSITSHKTHHHCCQNL